VSLVPRGRVAMQDLGLMTRMRCARCRPSVLVETDVVNRTDQPLSPVVDVSLRSPDRVLTSALHGAGSLGSGERRRVRFAVPIRGHVRLWSPGHPALYRALVRATVGDRVEQSERRSVGLRLVQVRHGRLYLNGRRLNARGASFHEDLPGQGAALDDSGLDRIFRDLRRLHAQVVRAHYLISQPLLDRFDRAGILVWSEAPNWQNDDLLRDPAGRAHALDLVRRTVVEARSHPSVFVHSVANELCLFAGRSYPTGSRTFLLDAVGVARGADPTLPVATTFNLPNPPCRDAYRYFDVLGDNAYLGWYGNAPVRTFRHRLDFLRRRYRRQALVVSEFGAEAFRNGPASEKGTYGFQKRWAKAALDVLDRIPYLSSALYWTSREFRIDAGWCGGACRGAENTLHQKGLFSYDGTLKPAGALVAARFARWRPLR
jgi:hypothetical protein